LGVAVFKYVETKWEWWRWNYSS